ncbi:hypothetical protein C8Q76DRAFT_423718 [Earliella scabrosa]|nr:hypothetical protein C8Q76DRAFT_423718 [Earliella scabrosa]
MFALACDGTRGARADATIYGVPALTRDQDTTHKEGLEGSRPAGTRWKRKERCLSTEPEERAAHSVRDVKCTANDTPMPLPDQWEAGHSPGCAYSTPCTTKSASSRAVYPTTRTTHLHRLDGAGEQRSRPRTIATRTGQKTARHGDEKRREHAYADGDSLTKDRASALRHPCILDIYTLRLRTDHPADANHTGYPHPHFGCTDRAPSIALRRVSLRAS